MSISATQLLDFGVAGEKILCLTVDERHAGRAGALPLSGCRWGEVAAGHG